MSPAVRKHPAKMPHFAMLQAQIFLSDLAPFSFLPEAIIEQVAEKLTLVSYAKGTILFVQGRTRVGHLYILQQGAADRYFEQDGEKTMQDLLGAGDLYGGISMLLNDGICVRTLEVIEESYFYLLAKKDFEALCESFVVFCDFFTDTFGKRMLDRSYAAIVARTAAPPDEVLPLLNQPVSQMCNRATVFGTSVMSIRQVAQRMQQENSTYLMIPGTDLQAAGIITESDLTRKVIATGHDINDLAIDIMSCPLQAVGEHTMVIEALMNMMQNDIKHLAVTDAQNQIVGVLTNRELITAQGQSPLFLLREISKADSIDAISEQHQRLPGIIKGLISSGATARNISRMITTVSDAILQKVMQFVLATMPPPPTDFVFLVLGSEGRAEQTLKTDQDNAIIFEDVSEAELPDVSAYFTAVGQKACALLDKAGYAYCEGDVMAQNPQWCQPLSVWMTYFLKWIYAAEPEDLLQASIFFDFRGGYGDMQLVEALRDYLHGAIRSWPGFLRHMTENAMYFKPPLGFFGNFVVESKGKHRDAFDIKSAMMPIVDFARVYAIKNGVSETNTLDRLTRLREKGILSSQDFEEIEKAYSFLLQLRFTRQVTAMAGKHAAPDNFINPKRLTRIEQTTLKEIFKRIERLQSKMGFEFMGMA